MVDGAIPTISISKDSSAFAGALDMAVAGTELGGLDDDRTAVAVVGADDTAMVVDWEGSEGAETDAAA